MQKAALAKCQAVHVARVAVKKFAVSLLFNQIAAATTDLVVAKHLMAQCHEITSLLSARLINKGISSIINSPRAQSEPLVSSRFVTKIEVDC